MPPLFVHAWNGHDEDDECWYQNNLRDENQRNQASSASHRSPFDANKTALFLVQSCGRALILLTLFLPHCTVNSLVQLSRPIASARVVEFDLGPAN